MPESKKIIGPADLDAIREKARREMDLRTGKKSFRITVHLGTCGIASGGRDVLKALAKELGEAAASKVALQQSGCIGLCDQEPMMTLKDTDGREFRYVRLDGNRVREIVRQHVIGGRPVEKYIAK
jgi:NADP-reducing hydrogenase subunit HndB